jgi:hypothetical protein
MEPQEISFLHPPTNRTFESSKPADGGNNPFRLFLHTPTSKPTGAEAVAVPNDGRLPGQAIPPHPPVRVASSKDAVQAYQKQDHSQTQAAGMSDVEKYIDDQLLSNPGGDHYYLNDKKVVEEPEDQKSFLGRIGKDISDALANVKNFFGDLLFGSTVHYRDENNEIKTVKRRGLLGSVVEFFKDLGSAFTFGLWRPDGEKEPKNFGERIGFFFSKIKEAIFGDLVQGVTNSIVHMAEDLVFAGWNLMEVVPDATIGNFEAGRKATTAFFDHGQVALDYITDILPSGDASIRVHSANLKEKKPPFFYNASLPERKMDDERWRYIRNTPFRKAIETVGCIFTDILTLKFLGSTRMFSEDQDGGP